MNATPPRTFEGGGAPAGALASAGRPPGGSVVSWGIIPALRARFKILYGCA
jgi:hypothetical protein